MWGTPSVVRRIVAWNCPSPSGTAPLPAPAPPVPFGVEPFGGVAVSDPLHAVASRARPTTAIATARRRRDVPNVLPPSTP